MDVHTCGPTLTENIVRKAMKHKATKEYKVFNIVYTLFVMCIGELLYSFHMFFLNINTLQ